MKKEKGLVLYKWELAKSPWGKEQHRQSLASKAYPVKAGDPRKFSPRGLAWGEVTESVPFITRRIEYGQDAF